MEAEGNLGFARITQDSTIAEEQTHATFRGAHAPRVLFSAAGRKPFTLQTWTSSKYSIPNLQDFGTVQPAAETVHASGVRSPIHDPCYP
jgi:hypothetical protein